jgi:hypothetical protein
MGVLLAEFFHHHKKAIKVFLFLSERVAYYFENVGQKFGGNFSWSMQPPAFRALSIGEVKSRQVGGKRGIISSSLIPIDLKNL